MLRHFITEMLLTEKTRYQKETGRDSAAELRQHLLSLASDTHPVQYAFTMTKIPKVGLNPQTSYNTPAGVYFYPLTTEYCQKLIDNKLPFASDNPYFGLVKLNNVNTTKWLKFIQSGQNFQTTANVMKACTARGGAGSGATHNGQHWKFNNDAKIFDVGFFATKNDVNPTASWNTFLRKLGYVGIYDSGNGIIHPSEPTQLVCLSPAAYITVGIWSTNEIRREQQLSYNGKCKLMDSGKISKKMLDILSKDDDARVRRLLALKLTTPDYILDKMSTDKDPMIREQVASNANTSKETLLKMTKDVNKTVRIHVLFNKNSDEEVLAILSKDSDYGVRAGVCSNPNTPVAIIETMLNDESTFVVGTIAERTKSPDILSKLSKHPSYAVTLAVAENIRCSKETLDYLAKHDAYNVRLTVARNPNTSMQTLITLSNDKDIRVRIAASTIKDDRLLQKTTS